MPRRARRAALVLATDHATPLNNDRRLAMTTTANNTVSRDNEDKIMLDLANFIAKSAHPEDPRLEVAYAIARYLKLDWPSSYEDA